MVLEINVFEFWWRKNNWLLKAEIDANIELKELDSILNYIYSLRDPITIALVLCKDLFVDQIMKKLEEERLELHLEEEGATMSAKPNEIRLNIIKNNLWDYGANVLGISPFKVLGIVDSWVVMRRKRAMPILAHVNSFGEGKQYFIVKKEPQNESND